MDITARSTVAVSHGPSLRERFASYWRRVRVFRETYDELNALTDRELADIGLSRAMIGDVAREAASEV